MSEEEITAQQIKSSEEAITQQLKPGQKHPTPTPGFGDRVFYETLLRQRPECHMAQEWCVNYGVLPYQEAEDLFAIITERKRKGGSSSSQTPTSKSKKSASSSSHKKKKKAKVVEDHVDPDMAISTGTEGIGTATL